MTAGTGLRQLDPDNPWPGLDSFEESAADYFHGREEEGDNLLFLVAENPVTVFYGKSGLGKTSLLKAGLFPRLRERHYLPVYIRLEVRSGAPAFWDQVRAALGRAVAEEGIDAPAPGERETVWEYLHRADVEFWDGRNYPRTPVLVFDQFEELFTLGQSVAEAVERFKPELGDLAENRIPSALAAALTGGADAAGLALRRMSYKVVVTLREDYLPEIEAWRRAIPSLGRVQARLWPMRFSQALSAVAEAAPHLMNADIANRIVRFVAAEPAARTGGGGAGPETAAGDGGRTIEPALLSLFCRELNERRKRGGKARFDAELIEGAQQGIVGDYYRTCLDGLPDGVSLFIENELITEKGFRNSYAKEDAVPAHLTEPQLDRLIARRLLRLEERYGTSRIELTHDVLTRAVREHRDWRRAEEERAALARQAEEARLALAEEASHRERQLEDQRRAEREKRLESEAMAGRRFRRLAAALAVALAGAVVMAGFAFQQRAQATASAKLATGSAAFAREQRQLAEQLLSKMTSGIRMKQAVLAGDREKIQAFLDSEVANRSIRFTARAEDLGYTNPQGQQVFRFLLSPSAATLPSGESAVAVVTYRMEHPTFQNALLTTGPDRNFTASYIGWGCLRNVVVLIEYVDPRRAPEIGHYDMCAAIGW